MSWNDDNLPSPAGEAALFAIHGDLDGEKESEFQEREQFIGLIIGAEEFLLSIALVREIIMLPPITYVPNAATFVDGVFNLRGTILPAINMRKMMGIARGKVTAGSRIIVARFEGTTFGLIVDGITYVVALLPTELENQTPPGKGTGAEFICSMSKQGQKICGILDLHRILKQAAGFLDLETEGGQEDAGSEEHAA